MLKSPKEITSFQYIFVIYHRTVLNVCLMYVKTNSKEHKLNMIIYEKYL